MIVLIRRYPKIKELLSKEKKENKKLENDLFKAQQLILEYRKVTERLDNVKAKFQKIKIDEDYLKRRRIAIENKNY